MCVQAKWQLNTGADSPVCAVCVAKLMVYTVGATHCSVYRLQVSVASQRLVDLSTALMLTGNEAVMKCSL